MKYKYSANIIQYLILALFLVLPGLAVDAQATNESEADRDIMGKALPTIDKNPPKVFDTAAFGLGWFWGVESQFGIIEGVIRTRVGYAGGTTDSATYRNIGDHTETVQVDFNTKKISYSQLLDIFWNSHSCTRQSGTSQYRNAIFYHNEDQRQQALASKDAVEQITGKTVRTAIAPLKIFTLAEDYHQKYLLKHSALKHLLDKYYTRQEDLVDSTAAARLNGYAGHNGTKAQLSRELESLGVGEQGKKALKKLVGE